jgi:hypothetical protein
VNWRELIEAGRRFDKICQEEFPVLGAYDVVMKQLDRSKLPKQEEVLKIFIFMNKWFSRVPLEKFEAFFGRYQSIWNILLPLTEFSLENTSLDSIVAVRNERLQVSRVIHYCFDALSDVIGSTPTSKALHISAPSMLMMWDTSIREEIAQGSTGYDFTYVFLPKTKEQIEEAISSYVHEMRCDRRSAIKEIRNQRGKNYPLTKMIDEYNWITITRGEKL